MEKLPNIKPIIKCIWNKHKNIPDTFTHTITITLDTSVDVESIKQWLLESLSESLQSIAIQTGAKETLVSIETTKL
jgi:hypothetical protein